MLCEFGVPQGSRLGSAAVLAHVSPIANVISCFGVSHSQYADDTELYICLKDQRALSSLSNCFNSVHWWFTLNGLLLNPKKSEATIIGTGAQQRSEGPLDEIDLSNVQIQPSESVRSLGVVIDNTLSFVRKRRGPITKPCGTPDVTGNHDDLDPLTTTHYSQ